MCMCYLRRKPFARFRYIFNYHLLIAADKKQIHATGTLSLDEPEIIYEWQFRSRDLNRDGVVTPDEMVPNFNPLKATVLRHAASCRFEPLMISYCIIFENKAKISAVLIFGEEVWLTR